MKTKQENRAMGRFLSTALAVVIVSGFAGGAQAATVKSIITNLMGGLGSTDNLVLNDEDVTIVYDESGTLKTSGALEVGDMFLGVIKITSADAGAPGGTQPVNQGVNQGLVGFYALKVSNITGNSSGDTISATWLEDSDVGLFTGIAGLADLADYGFGTTDKAMIAFFLDGDANGQSTVDDTVFDSSDPLGASFPPTPDFSNVTDGELWASFGDGTYDITAFNTAIFDVGAASAASSGSTLAEVTFSIRNVVNNTDYLQFNSNMTEDTRPGNTNASVLKGGGGGPVVSDISFLVNATIIPTPAALGPGLAMFAALGLVRPRRRRLA